MKIERATQLLFLLLISQGGNAAYANLPRGASASSVQVSAQANKITVSGTFVDVNGEPLVGVSVLEKVPETVRLPTWTGTLPCPQAKGPHSKSLTWGIRT